MIPGPLVRPGADSEAPGFMVAFIDADSFTPGAQGQIERQLAHPFGVLS
jgi:hypothetical protein